MSTLIKTCGMFSFKDIEAVNAARPDLMGFVVNVPKSHRSVTPARAEQLRAQLAPGIRAVGVFVDEGPHVIASMVRADAIDMVQLHGHEDENYLKYLSAICDAPVIQAFKIASEADVARAVSSSADVILLDNGCGTGERFDWSLLAGVTHPFILAGGLTPEAIPQAIAQLRPWAVDLSSGLEINKVKDPNKIAAAVHAVRACEG